MKLRELLDKWSLTKLNAGFVDSEFQANNQEKDAAWAMYVELLTRTTTPALPREHGCEAGALASVHALFGIMREIMRASGARHADKIAKIAIFVLDHKARLFTAHWHKASLAGAFTDAAQRHRFRDKLADLQRVLASYAGVQSDLAAVEDLTGLELA